MPRTPLAVPGLVALLCIPLAAQVAAVEYECRVEKKFNAEHRYTEAELKRW